MFYLQAIVEDNYYVYDTIDNSVESCTLNELLHFKKLGISIIGFSSGKIEGLNSKFVLVFELDGNLYGINKFSEVYNCTTKGYKLADAKVFFGVGSKLRVLSRLNIADPNYNMLICIEEIKTVKNSKMKLLKTQVFKVNTKTHTFTKVDEMSDFALGKHKILQYRDGKDIYYGSKRIARGV